MTGIRKKAEKLIKNLEDSEIEIEEQFPFHKVMWQSLSIAVRFVKVTVREFIDDRLLLKAMALTFATILSLVPLLVISFSVFRLFGGTEWFTEVVRPLIIENLAPGSGPAVAQRLEEVIEGAGSNTLGGIGVLLLLLAVYGIFSGIESIFNNIWEVSGRIGDLRRIPLYWGMVTIIPVLVMGSFAISTYIFTLPLVTEAFERVSFVKRLITATLPTMMLMGGFFLMYRFLPRTKVKSRAAASGAVIAGLLHESLKFVFILYTGKLVHYDIIYGSLAVVPLLLIWINFSWIVTLVGVEVSFVVQHWHTLMERRKHIRFSRSQIDALSYKILLDATDAFYGKREALTAEELSNYGIPPGIINAIIDKFEENNILLRAGKSFGRLILAKDPERINLCEVDNIISGETKPEWTWPESISWVWLKDLMTVRRTEIQEKFSAHTLSELVKQVNSDLKNNSNTKGEI